MSTMSHDQVIQRLRGLVNAGQAAQTAVDKAIDEVHARNRQRIAQCVRMVERDEPSIGVLSTGEQIAVAVVLDRKDLLPEGYTMVAAIDRLGRAWTDAALQVQRNGWRSGK